MKFAGNCQLSPSGKLQETPSTAVTWNTRCEVQMNIPGAIDVLSHISYESFIYPRIQDGCLPMTRSFCQNFVCSRSAEEMSVTTCLILINCVSLSLGLCSSIAFFQTSKVSLDLWESPIDCRLRSLGVTLRHSVARCLPEQCCILQGKQLMHWAPMMAMALLTSPGCCLRTAEPNPTDLI